jgi:hypothetical protein
MGDFGAQIAHRYGAHGTFWATHPDVPRRPIRYYQIWTEPHIPTSWPPKPDAAQYAALLRATSPRIKAADPSAQIVTGGISQSNLSGAVPLRTYIQQLYDAGGADGFDILAVNPYSETPAGSLALVQTARDIMLQRGDAAAGTWVTEIGWATGGTPYRFTTDEAGQATRLRQLFTSLTARRTALNLHGIIWYSWRDHPPPPDVWPFWTGLLRADATPKPGYFAYREMAIRLSQCQGGSGDGRGGRGGSSSLFGSGIPADFVGVSAPEVLWESQKHKQATMGRQALLGVQTLRQVFDRRLVRKRGRYDLWLYDRLVSAAAQDGMRVLPVLTDSPRVRSGARRRGRLASFAKALVARYGSNGTLWQERPRLPKLPIQSWQVWNEPNRPGAWGKRPSARGYGALLRSVALRLRRGDPAARVVTASLSYKRGAVPPRRFLARLYRVGARRSFDVVGLAPFAGTTGAMIKRARAFRRVMLRYRDRRKTIWITAFGWTDKGKKLRTGRKAQAAKVKKGLLLLARNRSRLALRGVVYVTWRDRRGRGQGWLRRAGLVNLRDKPKPAFRAFGRGILRFR